MTKSQAKVFVNRMLNSRDARIAGFLSKIYSKIGKSVPKIASAGAAKAGKHLAKKVAKKVGKAILKKVPIIGWVLIGADVITLGPKGAFNEAVWPISELWGGGGA